MWYNKDMPKTATIKGYIVHYEDDALLGLRYIENHLDYNEARVFFEQARNRGSAEFEDNNRVNFTLLHHDGAYTLVRR